MIENNVQNRGEKVIQSIYQKEQQLMYAQKKKNINIRNLIMDKLIPVLPATKIAFIGTIKEVPILTDSIKSGMVVLTPNGLGVIKSFDGGGINKNTTVVVWLFKKYHKQYPLNTLRQYIVYHTPTGQIIPLSSTDYRYIYGNNQTVHYRISNRLNIVLTDACKKEHQLIYNYSKKRNGEVLLKALRKGEIKIK